MKTTIEFTFALMPMDVRSGFALRRARDAEFQRRADELLARLGSALQPATTQAIEFEGAGPDVRSPEYVTALNNHAADLHVALAQDTGAILLALRGGAPVVPGATPADPGSSCQVQFSFADSSLCVPCGPNCHTVDGSADVVCRPRAAPTPLLWKTRSAGGDTLTYQIRVNYRFLYNGGV